MGDGLDYFGARYFSSAQGRFTTPDWSPQPSPVPYAVLTDPQTLNLYSYTRNNPLAFVDSDGHVLTVFGDATQQYINDLQKSSGLTLAVNKKGGVSITARPKQLSGIGQEVAAIIGDKKNTVKIEAMSQVPGGGVVGGAFLGHGEQLLDFSSIRAISRPGGFTEQSIVTHETAEAYQGLLNNGNFPLAHQIAIGYENEERVLVEGLNPRIGEIGVATPTGSRTEVNFSRSREVIDYDNRSGSVTRATVQQTNQPNPANIIRPIK